MSWQSATLGELCDKYGGFVQTGPFGSQLKQSEYVEDPNGIPVVMPKDIKGGRVVFESAARITEQKAQTLSRHFLADGDIIFPRRGDINKLAIVEEANAIFCGTGCLRIHTPSKGIVPKFLFYFLGQPKVAEWLEARAIGSTMLNLNTSIMRAVEVKFPNYPEQQRIAPILSAYDDLIENNRRRIGLLEDAARQLYKEWFVRFRFPGHEHVKMIDGVPEGWERKTLREVASLNYGKALKDSTRIAGDVPVYGSSGIVGSHNKALVAGPGIILGRKGNVGSVRWSHSDFFPIDTVYFIASEESTFHLYLTLLHMQFLSTDVAVPGLNRDFAYSRLLLRPPAAVAERFEDEVTPIFFQMQKLTDWNSKLAQARDLILPRLMNGSLTV